jgi:hypothetical protein
LYFLIKIKNYFLVKLKIKQKLELMLVPELAAGATVHLHAQESTNASLLLCQARRCGSWDSIEAQIPCFLV